jgi:nicotinamide-nucleotide amidase
MLPAGAEMIDNPIGTACGFSLTIGRACFYFTPGVPREMRRMLDEQLIPRLLAQGGVRGVTRLKRFHSFGIGESRADRMLTGIETLAPGSDVKLGFQAHYPQLETKLMARGADAADLERSLAPIEAELRRRLGNFIVAEDDQTLEGVIQAALRAQGSTLAIAETFTGGGIANRLASLEGAESLFRRGAIARDLVQLCAATGLDIGAAKNGTSTAMAAAIAAALRAISGASHTLAVLVELDEGADRLEFGGMICIGIADTKTTVVRQAHMLGGRDWVCRGAVELGLDCLRRYLIGLPVDEQIDFEKR